ncbi:MAG: ornithine carbamoyltransferase [Deltaproteobacteria bacterium]|nr:ornithine carbamoyltransferase [Deltaproteobacteria bacterium]
MKNYLSELDLDVEETMALLFRAKQLKAQRGEPRSELAGRHVALYFEKPSVRTRVSFTVAVHELGGQVIELGPSNTKVGKGEDERDFAKVIGRYVHGLVARVFSQDKLQSMAAYAGVPVINALSDERHPCQALADVLTIQERKGELRGLRFAFVGEGNNVATSTGLLLAALGAQVRVASPAGYGLPPAVLDQAQGLAGTLTQVEDPVAAVRAADVVYTDTWISMGQEAEAEARRQIFGRYRVDQDLMRHADDEAIVMHCLPAVRGEEIDGELMYEERSALWDQAENRLHVQKALLLELLAG